MQTEMKVKCPFCNRNKKLKVMTIIPREVFDCRCGAEIEVKPIKEVLNGKGVVWSVDWTPPKS